MAHRRMAYRGRKPLTEEEQLEVDRAFLRALEQLEDYAPEDPALSIAALQKLESDWLAAREARELAEKALEQARAKRNAAVLGLAAALRDLRRNFVMQYGDQGYTVQEVALMAPWDEQAPFRLALAG